MYKIDEIIEMLDCNNDVLIQQEGIELAKDVKHIHVFFRPINKNTWKNCAKVLYGRTDEELSDYLMDMFDWIRCLNTQGAKKIYQRLEKFKKDELFKFFLQMYISKATMLNDKVWLNNLTNLVDE